MNKQRRRLIAFAAIALGAPSGAFGQQQSKVWRVGFLAHRRIEFVDSDWQYGPFRNGMRELGYVEGKNLLIEWRFADGHAERLPGLAAELVKLKLDVIVTGGTQATLAAQRATSTAPIVMSGVGDPIGSGFAKSLARPGGNITGVTNINVDLGPKQLEMLLAIVPKVMRVAILVNPTNASHAAFFKGCQDGARRLRLKEVMAVTAQNPRDIEAAFATMARDKVEALLVSRDAFIHQQLRQIADQAAKALLPVMAGLQEYVQAGGLIGYGPSIRDQYRRAAYYVDRILRGAKPADLPVEQPMTFELAVNLKAAKALELTIPGEIMVRATRVLE